jgi:hypothetical protein
MATEIITTHFSAFKYNTLSFLITFNMHVLSENGKWNTLLMLLKELRLSKFLQQRKSKPSLNRDASSKILRSLIYNFFFIVMTTFKSVY